MQLRQPRPGSEPHVAVELESSLDARDLRKVFEKLGRGVGVDVALPLRRMPIGVQSHARVVQREGDVLRVGAPGPRGAMCREVPDDDRVRVDFQRCVEAAYRLLVLPPLDVSSRSVHDDLAAALLRPRGRLDAPGHRAAIAPRNLDSTVANVHRIERPGRPWRSSLRRFEVHDVTVLDLDVHRRRIDVHGRRLEASGEKRCRTQSNDHALRFHRRTPGVGRGDTDVPHHDAWRQLELRILARRVQSRARERPFGRPRHARPAPGGSREDRKGHDCDRQEAQQRAQDPNEPHADGALRSTHRGIRVQRTCPAGGPMRCSARGVARRRPCIPTVDPQPGIAEWHVERLESGVRLSGHLRTQDATTIVAAVREATTGAHQVRDRPQRRRADRRRRHCARPRRPRAPWRSCGSARREPLPAAHRALHERHDGAATEAAANARETRRARRSSDRGGRRCRRKVGRVPRRDDGRGRAARPSPAPRLLEGGFSPRRTRGPRRAADRPHHQLPRRPRHRVHVGARARAVRGERLRRRSRSASRWRASSGR